MTDKLNPCNSEFVVGDNLGKERGQAEVTHMYQQQNVYIWILFTGHIFHRPLVFYLQHIFLKNYKLF